MRSCIFVCLFLIGFFQTLSSQITIDYQTLSVQLGPNVEFKTGNLIDVVIFHYDPNVDNKITVEITGDQYENTNGIATFGKYNSTEKASPVNTSTTQAYVLSLQVPDKDVSLVKITIYDKTDGLKKDERTYFFRNEGGMKFDVSSGFFMTDLRDESYSLKSIDTDTKQIFREDNGKHRVGVGLLAHVHWRYRGWFTTGLCGGFEINTDAKVGYLGGLSFFAGYDRKFVLSGGAAFSKVKTLSAIYQEGEEVPFAVNEVPTVENWKLGWFASLSYNF